jgi:ABC-type dipeptide/oligopeptide/nickel transport system permease component
MLAFILRRAIQAIGVMIVVGVVSFSMFRFAGDPVDQRSAEIEAAKSLTEIARDTAPFGRHRMAIEVRTDEGPLFQASFIFELTSLKH